MAPLPPAASCPPRRRRTRIRPPLSALALLCSCALAGAETLRSAADGRLLIGCAVAATDLDDPRLAALIADQFSCLTPEYDLMPEHLVDDHGAYTFDAGDRVVAFAQAHGMPVFGHMLVWHFVTRKWLFEGTDGKPLPRAQALARLERYITGVVGHYRGRIRAWDVVNEAISDQDGG
jgi:endo-1,4-beta-xylanase